MGQGFGGRLRGGAAHRHLGVRRASFAMEKWGTNMGNNGGLR